MDYAGSVNDFSGPRALPFITFLDLSLRDSFNFNGLSFNQLVGLGQVTRTRTLIIDVTNSELLDQTEQEVTGEGLDPDQLALLQGLSTLLEIITFTEGGLIADEDDERGPGGCAACGQQ